MKKIWNYIIVALAGLSLLSCNVKELPEETPSTDGFTYTIAIACDTKVYLDDDHMTWVSGDEIGWFTDQAGHSAVDMSADPRSFEVSSAAALAAGARIYAYAPYMEGYEFTDVEAAPLFIPVEQNNIISNAMPMVSLPIELSDAMSAQTGTPVGQASFVNLGAVIEYNVYTSDTDYAGETINSVTFTATSPIAGDFTVDLTAVTAESIPVPTGLTEYSVTSNADDIVGTSKAEGVKVYQVVAPGTLSGTITVTTNAATYDYTVTSKEFNRGMIKTINVNLGSDNATRTEIISIEELLTSHKWVLTDVLEAGESVASSTGNTIKFNSDHTMTFDCSANNGQTYDHTWVGGLIDPDDYDPVSDFWWEVSTDSGTNYINVTYGYMLVFAQESMSGNYEILTLDDSHLTVAISTYDETWTLVFEAAPDIQIDELLTSHEWVLTGVLEAGVNVTTSTGNTIKFNSDHTMTFDCSANNGQTYDHTWVGGLIDPDDYDPVSDFWWEVSTDSGTNYINVTYGYMLVFAQESMSGNYEILTLDDSHLTVAISTYNETWTLLFEATPI